MHDKPKLTITQIVDFMKADVISYSENISHYTNLIGPYLRRDLINHRVLSAKYYISDSDLLFYKPLLELYGE